MTLRPATILPGDKPGDAHRRAYPEQYRHPLVGKRVEVKPKDKVIATGIVQCVVSSSFGMLAKLEDDETGTFWLVNHCKEVP